MALATKRRRDRAPVPVAAYSIEEFCAAHRLSRSRYYELREEGLAPAEMIVGKRRFVSVEAAARWRREREIPTTDTAA